MHAGKNFIDYFRSVFIDMENSGALDMELDLHMSVLSHLHHTRVYITRV